MGRFLYASFEISRTIWNEYILERQIDTTLPLIYRNLKYKIKKYLSLSLFLFLSLFLPLSRYLSIYLSIYLSKSVLICHPQSVAIYLSITANFFHLSLFLSFFLCNHRHFRSQSTKHLKLYSMVRLQSCSLGNVENPFIIITHTSLLTPSDICLGPSISLIEKFNLLLGITIPHLTVYKTQSNFSWANQEKTYYKY